MLTKKINKKRQWLSFPKKGQGLRRTWRSERDGRCFSWDSPQEETHKHQMTRSSQRVPKVMESRPEWVVPQSTWHLLQCVYNECSLAPLYSACPELLFQTLFRQEWSGAFGRCSHNYRWWMWSKLTVSIKCLSTWQWEMISNLLLKLKCCGWKLNICMCTKMGRTLGLKCTISPTSILFFVLGQSVNYCVMGQNISLFSSCFLSHL